MAKNETREILEKARKLGLNVKRPGDYPKFTSYPHEDVLKRFRAVAAAQRLKLKEAITEAMELWVESKTKGKKS